MSPVTASNSLPWRASVRKRVPWQSGKPWLLVAPSSSRTVAESVSLEATLEVGMMPSKVLALDFALCRPSFRLVSELDFFVTRAIQHDVLDVGRQLFEGLLHVHAIVLAQAFDQGIGSNWLRRSHPFTAPLARLKTGEGHHALRIESDSMPQTIARRAGAHAAS